MTELELKEEFEKHMRSRASETPSKNMAYDLFLEGYKLGISELELNRVAIGKDLLNEDGEVELYDSEEDCETYDGDDDEDDDGFF